MREPERTFLLAVVKCAVALLVILMVGVLAHMWLPELLAGFVAVPIGLLALSWALRGTAFDPLAAFRR